MNRHIIAVPARDSDGNVPDLYGLNRASLIEGSEVGFANLTAPDSDAILDSDSRVSPTVINLSDSDGNITKIVRDLGLI